MALPPQAYFSIIHMKIGRSPNGGIRYGYAWAAWWTKAPAAKPWVTPDSCGIVERKWDIFTDDTWSHARDFAEIAADEACREALGPGCETRMVDESFAAAAIRETEGRPPRYRAPRPRAAARPRQERPPHRAAAPFFAALWIQQEEEFQRFRASWSTEGRATQSAAHAPEALRALGLSASAKADDVHHAFRQRCLRAHPDKGGSDAEFIALVALRDAALAAVGSR